MKALFAIATGVPLLFGAVPVSADDPASIVGNLATRALVSMQNPDTVIVQGQFRQLFRQYFDAEACARSALGAHWQDATTEQRQEYVKRYEDYIVIVYSALLGHLGGESITVLRSQPDESGVLVTSRINGVDVAAPIGVDWQINPTNSGYKVTNV